MSRGWVFAGAIVLVIGIVSAIGVRAQVPSAADQRARLATAQREASAAAARADMLARRAAGERNAADRARIEEASLAAWVTAAAAELAGAKARAALVDQRLAVQRARLGGAQAPVARLLAALQSLARRPTVVAIAQPGSVDDLVHVRAVLGSALPVVRARTAAVRADVVRMRSLQASAAAAAAALARTRSKLEADRVALATLEATHRQRSRALGRGAMGESDRALALGEQARELVDRMTEEGSAATTAIDLAAIGGPRPRPVAAGSVVPTSPRGVYRLAVRGRLMTGFDEVSASGVRSRGLTFAVPPAAPVVAPAGGVVRYAGRFRAYGVVVIVDHGGGWTSLIAGLGETAVKVGTLVAMGAPIGRAPTGDEPRVTVELRRRGRPIDMAALVG
ncbi:murein hydrolase activator EnvC family protein [uncultured Sphingomonas sp.]|uniref:murein hydrolase activator EnvC family protein n=1 Tax=uncultured Sphingomonas sp. TaxID=158754 RepID=UPI0035C9B74A